ncbi:MAG: FIST signal transduction protein [Sandaracinaceae bacterium]
MKSVFSEAAETSAAAAELVAKLEGTDPVLILFFTWHEHDGAAISKALNAAYPNAQVAGATTAGEFTHERYGHDGVVAIAFGQSKVKRCASAWVRMGAGVEAGMNDAVAMLSSTFGSLRELDPARHVGFVLNTFMPPHEEEVNEALGHAAPLLSFVGGSAGDNYQIKRTQVFLNGEASDDASVLVLMETGVPFSIVKTSSFEPTGKKLEITKIQGRVVYELDGQPALPTYAAAVGVPVEALDHPVYLQNPLGLMIDGKPWVRSPIQALPDGGLLFGAAMIEGSEMNLMRPTDLFGDTRAALAEGAARLGGNVSCGVIFNCAHRSIGIEMRGLQKEFANLFGDYPVAGFNSYGESWLTHINQTLIGLLFG